MALNPFVAFLGGWVVILLGAEMLLRSASRLAAMLRFSPILIGLTVVSVGNIAGTNRVNILLILGLSAWMRPLPTRAFDTQPCCWLET
jgi:cation:H+ antiporter